MMTELHLLNVPLENTYQHTLWFDSVGEQTKYFKSCIYERFSNYDFSYQRKDKTIRFPAYVDDLNICNYVMYKNTENSSKWFYAFITELEYVNDNMTLIHIETDVMQTWIYGVDYRVNPSFIEREHVADDTIGLHTIPESLETGDYVINVKNKCEELNDTCIIMATTVDLNDFEEHLLTADKYTAIGGDTYNGIFSGVRYWLMTKADCKSAIEALASTGQSDAIVSIFTAPTALLGDTVGSEFCEVKGSISASRIGWVENGDGTENYKPTNLDGYEDVKNNKLFTYPYCYMLLTNNVGGSAVYKYELFAKDCCQFYIYGALTPSMSICISPREYNGVEINSLERLQGGKFPICAWNTDVYTNWLVQNATNIPLSIGSAVIGLGVAAAGIALAPATGGSSALATVGAIGAGVGGATAIGNTVSEVYQHSLQPPQAEGNIGGGDVAFASGILTFTAYQMTIKKEIAKSIDNYFSMFGYKVNRVGTPRTKHRENYWYTKTIDVSIRGWLPADDLNKIKEVFNKGITFWVDPNNVGDYSVSNACTN